MVLISGNRSPWMTIPVPSTLISCDNDDFNFCITRETSNCVREKADARRMAMVNKFVVELERW